MPRKKFSPEDIIQILRTVEIEQSKGLSSEEALRKVGVSPASYSRWRKEYGGLRVDQAKRLKELEQENGRLKRIVADLSVNNSILNEVARGNF
jgi:transposase-like protein